MPRNDLKAYETLTARIPQDLVDAVKQYASLHHRTVSDLIRDSLQQYLDAESTGMLEGRGQDGLQGQTEVLQEVVREVIQAVRQGQTEVLQEVRRGHVSLAQVLAALPVQGQTEAILGSGREVLQGQTTRETPVSMVKDEGLTSVLQSQTGGRPHEALPPFDPVKSRLGKLCPQGHDYHGTGQSLRANNKGGYCRACNAQSKRREREQKRQAQGQEVSA